MNVCDKFRISRSLSDVKMSIPINCNLSMHFLLFSNIILSLKIHLSMRIEHKFTLKQHNQTFFSSTAFLDCGECTSARSQWEGCIQSKSTWLMFIYLFSLRRWKYLGSIQCKHLEYTAYFWKGNIRIYANLVG